MTDLVYLPRQKLVNVELELHLGEDCFRCYYFIEKIYRSLRKKKMIIKPVSVRCGREASSRWLKTSAITARQSLLCLSSIGSIGFDDEKISNAYFTVSHYITFALHFCDRKAKIYRSLTSDEQSRRVRTARKLSLYWEGTQWITCTVRENSSLPLSDANADVRPRYRRYSPRAHPTLGKFIVETRFLSRFSLNEHDYCFTSNDLHSRIEKQKAPSSVDGSANFQLWLISA